MLCKRDKWSNKPNKTRQLLTGIIKNLLFSSYKSIAVRTKIKFRRETKFRILSSRRARFRSKRTRCKVKNQRRKRIKARRRLSNSRTGNPY